MENHIEPPEVVEYRSLDMRMERGEVTQAECERYFLLAHLLVNSLGPYSYPEQVGVIPHKVAKHSQLYPEAALAASLVCWDLGIPNSSV